MKFEKIQLDILSSRERNQLVSAGAGSGKTTVMIEKIKDLIVKDNVPISSLLVVTFTVLAANEMKTRLIDKLNKEFETNDDKARILSLIEEIKTASIDTIDGFSSKTIRKYFYELEISPNVEIISDASRDYYMTRAMNKTINNLQINQEKTNIILDLFGGSRRNFDNFKELIINIYHNIINIYDYERFLLKAEQEYINPTQSEKIVLNYIIRRTNSLKQIIRDNFSSCGEMTTKLQTMLDGLEEINSNISLKSNLIILKNINMSTFSSKECNINPNLIDINEGIKDFKSLKLEFEKYGIDENFDIKNIKIVDYFAIFIEVLKNFIENYKDVKEKNHLIDFNDLNRLMLKLLNNDRIREELQNKYRYLFIDEYQDVNPLQDALMSKLIGEETNLFTVGDVKQSIYGFRGASPEWFLNKYDEYKKDKSLGVAFDMNINFRSNPKILSFVNEIFSLIMTKENSGIDYKADAMIDPKRTDILDDKVKVMLVKSVNEESSASGVYSVKEASEEEQSVNSNAEAILVLKTITELIGTKFYDANTMQERILEYKDIAILSRSEKDEDAQDLISLLKESGIPVNTNNKLEVLKSEAVRLILSILKCVSGVADDVDYFASFMALSGLQIDDIVRFRETKQSFREDLLLNKDNENIGLSYQKIEDIRRASFTRTNKELIRYILDDIKVKYYILSRTNGDKQINLIEEFLNKISSIENRLNLNEFIEVIESNISKGTDYNECDNENSITIETIHKSKGLEYPVVILYSASKMFSYLRENDGVNFNVDVGLGVNYYDQTNRIKSYSLTKYAIKLANAEKGRKEEMRLLYVALTRAKNKLFITGKYSSNMFEKGIKKTSYMNTILSCYEGRLVEGDNQFNFCDITFIDDVSLVNNDQSATDLAIECTDFDYKYPNEEKFNVSFKNTVTGLNSTHSQISGFKVKQWLAPETQYEATEDKASIGVHYHKALEKLDLLSNYVQSTHFEDVDYEKIKLAHKVLTKLTIGAKDIKKEADFMMYVPYNELTKSNIHDRVLVQGVVDLLIEYEDKFIIVDYKFSHLPAQILKQRYNEQLNLYKLAVEKAYNKKVEHMYIYSINSGELV